MSDSEEMELLNADVKYKRYYSNDRIKMNTTSYGYIYGNIKSNNNTDIYLRIKSAKERCINYYEKKIRIKTYFLLLIFHVIFFVTSLIILFINWIKETNIYLKSFYILYVIDSLIFMTIYAQHLHHYKNIEIFDYNTKFEKYNINIIILRIVFISSSFFFVQETNCSTLICYIFNFYRIVKFCYYILSISTFFAEYVNLISCQKYGEIESIKYMNITKYFIYFLRRTFFSRKISHFTRLLYKNINIINVYPCYICENIFIETDEIIILPCNHIFHYSCIFSWLCYEHNCFICCDSLN
jgi:RING-finger-containing ubiquitin ligase